MLSIGERLDVLRMATRQSFGGLRFDVWMPRSKAAPLSRGDEHVQMVNLPCTGSPDATC